jgi:BMFP domain-containing protein YqiC
MIGNLLNALDEVHRGDLDPRQASAMAALAGAVTRAYTTGVLESRIEALEQQQQEGQAA